MPMVDELQILRFKEVDRRPVVQASLGMEVPGAVMPHPDPGHTLTTVTGSMYRLGRKINRNEQIRPRFRAFVKKWLKENLVPLSPSLDTSFDYWIERTPYTLARKEELKRKFHDSNLSLSTNDIKILKKFFKMKCFVKDEVYETWKHARGINSRTDEFKCLVGPIIQLISNEVFSLPWFIKKIPIQDRPQYIIDMLYEVGATYFTSDFTSFEAHFTPDMMDDCEMELFRHMVQFIPDGQNFINIMQSAKCGVSHLCYKNASYRLFGKRMSGEMDTSLSNGFSNLMFILFLASEAGCKNVRGVIEGDDGLFKMAGKPPDQKAFADFGLIIKLVEVKDLNHASFCGMVFDLEDRTNVTDPIAELVTFGWTRANYARSSKNKHYCLLRAKALSLAYQYPACPILTKLAYKVCQLTAGYDSLSFLKSQNKNMVDSYYYDMMLKAHLYFDKNQLNREPGMNTRLLVEQLYRLPVASQLIIEKYIDGMKTIEPINCPEILAFCNKSWTEYYDRYTCVFDYRNTNPDEHGLIWPAIRPPADISAFFKKPKG